MLQDHAKTSKTASKILAQILTKIVTKILTKTSCQDSFNFNKLLNRGLLSWNSFLKVLAVGNQQHSGFGAWNVRLESSSARVLPLWRLCAPRVPEAEHTSARQAERLHVSRPAETEQCANTWQRDHSESAEADGEEETGGGGERGGSETVRLDGSGGEADLSAARGAGTRLVSQPEEQLLLPWRSNQSIDSSEPWNLPVSSDSTDICSEVIVLILESSLLHEYFDTETQEENRINFTPNNTKGESHWVRIREKL